jgi:hypothetical protein
MDKQTLLLALLLWSCTTGESRNCTKELKLTGCLGLEKCTNFTKPESVCDVIPEPGYYTTGRLKCGKDGQWRENSGCKRVKCLFNIRENIKRRPNSACTWHNLTTYSGTCKFECKNGIFNTDGKKLSTECLNEKAGIGKFLPSIEDFQSKCFKTLSLSECDLVSGCKFNFLALPKPDKEISRSAIFAFEGEPPGDANDGTLPISCPAPFTGRCSQAQPNCVKVAEFEKLPPNDVRIGNNEPLKDEIANCEKFHFKVKTKYSVFVVVKGKNEVENSIRIRSGTLPGNVFVLRKKHFFSKNQMESTCMLEIPIHHKKNVCTYFHFLLCSYLFKANNTCKWHRM